MNFSEWHKEEISVVSESAYKDALLKSQLCALFNFRVLSSTCVRCCRLSCAPVGCGLLSSSLVCSRALVHSHRLSCALVDSCLLLSTLKELESP